MVKFHHNLAKFMPIFPYDASASFVDHHQYFELLTPAKTP
jgi:hypothetical protein